MKIINLIKKILKLKKEKEVKNMDEMIPNECYMNRELSWLKFNERVLDEAGNDKVPLAERLTFASIYQTNLDEFFMVRVGTLMMQMHSDENAKDNKTGMSPKEQIHCILDKVKELEDKRGIIYEQLMGELEPKGIRIINFNRLSNEEGKLLEAYFDNHIAPFLSPTIISKQQPFPFLANKNLYAIVLLKTRSGKRKFGMVACSNRVFKRLIEIPTRPGTFMLSEELVLHFVNKLYPKHIVYEKAILRITRNADIDEHDVYDEDLDYCDIMEKMIKKRTKMAPVRAELSRDVEPQAKKELAHYLHLDKKNIIVDKAPMDMSFVFQIQNRLHENKNLFYEKRVPQEPKTIDRKRSIISQIEEKDILLSYPYESMKPFIRLLEEAAEDDTVVSIKMTLYRLANPSKVVDALIEAAENGKEVVVMVELRARFDEANNIEMARRFEDAGVQVIYGLDQYKVHSKLCLITRYKDEQTKYITQIGTGNYNEKTARLYTDFSLMTSNEQIGKDASNVFNSLQRGETVDNADCLLVAPHCLQNNLIKLIDEEIEKGKNGYIGIKVNSLTDKVLIDELIKASRHGVQIELIVRGICCLVPQIKGYSDNIKVVSIVGRYLEHARIYRFGKGKNQKVYIASADFMTRNTLRRVEIAAPVFDSDIKEKITRYFDTQIMDDEKGKELKEDGNYYERLINNPKINSQELFFEESYNMNRKE